MEQQDNNVQLDKAFLQKIGELAKVTQQLAKQAVQTYRSEVNGILKAQSLDVQRIEHCLDGMLDFCFDADMLQIYKKLCRYYFKIDPEATAYHINAYREMWDQTEEQAEVEESLNGSM